MRGTRWMGIVAMALASCHESTTPSPPTSDSGIPDARSDAYTIGDPLPDFSDGSVVIYGEVDVSKLGKACKTSETCKATENCIYFPNVGFRCFEGSGCSVVTCPPSMVCRGDLADPGAVYCQKPAPPGP